MNKALEDLTPLIEGGGGLTLKYRVGRDYVPKQKSENNEFLASKKSENNEFRRQEI